jgi:hypothetical protein
MNTMRRNPLLRHAVFSVCDFFVFFFRQNEKEPPFAGPLRFPNKIR